MSDTINVEITENDTLVVLHNGSLLLRLSESQAQVLSHELSVKANLAARNVRRKQEEADRAAAAAIPVDRSAQVLTDGSPVTPDHRELEPDGQQKAYVVLSAAERAKGFVRPFRDAYRHKTCGAITIMSKAIAETYARDPSFYNATFCRECRKHLPLSEFNWYEMDGSEGPTVGS